VGQRGVQFQGLLAKPTSLCNAISNNPIFYFSTGARDHVLVLGWPRDEVVPKEDDIIKGRPASV
jgi:hypothetical protein